MSFLPHQSDNGLQPWEYYPAAAGEYKVGQMVNLTDGKLAPIAGASTTTPQFLCMASVALTEGQNLPVMRVTHDMVFESQLSAEAADAKIGSKLQVSAGGLQVDAAATGTFCLTSIEDTAAGATVYGRFQ